MIQAFIFGDATRCQVMVRQASPKRFSTELFLISDSDALIQLTRDDGQPLEISGPSAQDAFIRAIGLLELLYGPRRQRITALPLTGNGVQGQPLGELESTSAPAPLHTEELTAA